MLNGDLVKYNTSTYFSLIFRLDVDECATGIHKCGPNEKCINKDGGYLCQCHPGYMPIGEQCEDIDECIRFKGKVTNLT